MMEISTGEMAEEITCQERSRDYEINGIKDGCRPQNGRLMAER